MTSPFAAIVLATTAFAAPELPGRDQEDGAVQVAKAWFTSLMHGDTEVSTTLSSVPFTLDRKHEIASLEELRKVYKGVVESKGKRDPKIISAKVESSTPEKITVSIKIEKDDEVITVFIKPGDALHVIGFAD